MEAGYVEVTTSQSEKIGLPNWSFGHLMASAKAQVPAAQFAAAYEYLSLVVNTNVRERAETAARSLNMWGMFDTQTLTPEQKSAIAPPPGLELSMVELTVSLKETVGLPEKSSVDLLGSVKALAAPGTELATLDHLEQALQVQFKGKRDACLENPRPWTTNR